MRRVDAAAEALRRLPTGVAFGGLATLQLLSLAALAQTGDWSPSPSDAVVGAALATAELALLYGIGRLLGGPPMALLTGLVWIVAPLVLLRYWVVGGRPPTDFGPIYHEQFLPSAFGLVAPGAVAAGCLLLLSGWLVLAPLPRATVAAAAAGAAVAAAAVVHPRVWPALAAPALAYAAARRPRAVLASAAAALLGLAALALVRDVPGLNTSWHGIGVGLDQFREFSWSRRVLEYLPLAGLIGLARRSTSGAVFFGWLLATVIVVPLGRPLDLLSLLGAIVPGLPVYALLTASIVFLVPGVSAAAAHARPEPT
jgi:hypothetical protein